MILRKKAFENIVGKGENTGNQHFLIFPGCFLLFPSFSTSVTFILWSAKPLFWTGLKFCCVVKELKEIGNLMCVGYNKEISKT